jgi:carbon monoxide dehydrogenase subunit G
VELANNFLVNLPVDQAWAVLTDLERIAPCLPGAALTGTEGEQFHGGVKIKVGPVTAQYKGVAWFLERDDQAHRAVIRAEGKDVGGQGNAAATVTATLTSRGEGTAVSVVTDLALSGRVAQFGRGVIADVSNKLLGQFVQRLEAEVASSGARTEPSGPAVTSTTPARPSLDDVEPLDLMSSAGATLGKRALPVAAALLGFIVGVLFTRRGGRGRRAPLTAQSGWQGAVPLVINLALPAVTATSDVRKPNEGEGQA